MSVRAGSMNAVINIQRMYAKRELHISVLTLKKT